ncbi:WD40-like Beta Propeller Repeat family protein [Lyngbya aestuarii BL J]|uniref:WD40-like Beta Propeller Repeat family protein n=1 Tax=Lyngbya aestuarii BL J TaxID=1348334 RepID=U7QET4_9CYAN|nr:TolB family protein [Lyngbya aestuarii]ERT05797.1 WD40-like Beta Propeller Repeat family protein [Lyngbya aestuarii BL J]
MKRPIRAIAMIALCLILRFTLVVPEVGAIAVNSSASDEQPTLSGNGQFLAYVSNRNGQRQIVLYDLQRQTLIDLPGLNQGSAIAENPSLSNTARYLVYLASDSGRPEIELYDRKTNRVQIVSQGYRGWVRHPRISPDGRYIVFESGRRGQWDLEVLDRGSKVELDTLDQIENQGVSEESQ